VLTPSPTPHNSQVARGIHRPRAVAISGAEPLPCHENGNSRACVARGMGFWNKPRCRVHGIPRGRGLAALDSRVPQMESLQGPMDVALRTSARPPHGHCHHRPGSCAALLSCSGGATVFRRWGSKCFVHEVFCRIVSDSWKWAEKMVIVRLI
jgi:hypothetical protein